MSNIAKGSNNMNNIYANGQYPQNMVNTHMPKQNPMQFNNGVPYNNYNQMARSAAVNNYNPNFNPNRSQNYQPPRNINNQNLANSYANNPYIKQEYTNGQRFMPNDQRYLHQSTAANMNRNVSNIKM